MFKATKLIPLVLAVAVATNAAQAAQQVSAPPTGGIVASREPYSTHRHAPGQQNSDETGLVYTCTMALAVGNYRSAEQICGRAILLQPNNPAPYKLRGFSFLMEGRYEQARYDFTQAVRLAPRDGASYFGLAEALRDQGDYNGAMRWFSVAINLMPEDAQFWNARCWTRGIFAKEIPQGLADCNVALRLDPGNAVMLDSRGLIYLRLRRLDDAIRDYDAAIAKMPGLATALYGRGVARFRSGDPVDANRDIEAARTIDPNVEGAFSNAPLLSPACRLPANCGGQRSPRPRQQALPESGRSAMLKPTYDVLGFSK